MKCRTHLWLERPRGRYLMCSRCGIFANPEGKYLLWAHSPDTRTHDEKLMERYGRQKARKALALGFQLGWLE